MLHETEHMEFKETLTSDIYKSVVAFANTNGGTIIIGMRQSGETAPLLDVDDTYTRITNGIRDAIAPDVTIFVKYSLEADQTIRVEIGEGSFKPYYLKSKGLKPSGVYVRQGASSVPASPEQIRQMIKMADGDAFEEFRSLEQELTFHYCAQTFAAHKTDFSEDKYNALGVRSHTTRQYTNLGLLLSDQCAHSVKVAVFSDKQNTIFRDRKEFTGSVFAQMEEAFSYLQLCNQNRSEIDGLTRVDYWDYPKDALREALLNALIHRDYSYSGSIIINVNDRCMEFISLGGLLPGLSPEDIRSGISQLRNRKLAEAFHRLNYIEAYGTGIRRIFAFYADCAEQPAIAVTPNSFKITLPNQNAVKDGNLRQQPTGFELTKQMQTLLAYLAEHQEISDEGIQELLDIKRTRAYTLTKQMADEGIIEIIGRGASKKYTLAKQAN